MKKSIFAALLALCCFCGCQQSEKVPAVDVPPESPPVQEEVIPEAEETAMQTMLLEWTVENSHYDMTMEIQLPETWGQLSRISLWDEQERYAAGCYGVVDVLEEGQSLADLHDLQPEDQLVSSEIITMNGKEYLLEINDVWNQTDENTDPHEVYGDHIYYNYYFLQDDHVIRFFFVHYDNSAERLAFYEQVFSSMTVELGESYAEYGPLADTLAYAAYLNKDFSIGNMPEIRPWDWYYFFDTFGNSRPSIYKDDYPYWPAEEVEELVCSFLNAEPEELRRSTSSYNSELNAYACPEGLGGVGPHPIITHAEKDGNVSTIAIDLYVAGSTMKMHSCTLTVETTDKGWRLISNEILMPDISYHSESFTFTAQDGKEHRVTLEVPDTWVFENHAFYHADNPDFEVAAFPAVTEPLAAGQSLTTYQDKMLLLNRDYPINYDYFTLDGRDFNVETYDNNSKYYDSPHQYLHACYFVEDGYIYSIHFCDRGEIWDEQTVYKHILSSIHIQ